MKLLIFGNSGSGKSTFAKAMAERHNLAHLDLDAIVWEPGKIAVARTSDAILADLDRFITNHERWVIEGCYGELVEAAAPACDRLIFLNPGLDTCLANNRRRPWEPHKYASPELQESMLAQLQTWVAGYYDRSDDWSMAAHRRIFEAHAGNKVECIKLATDALIS